jgi:hypothetical protein
MSSPLFIQPPNLLLSPALPDGENDAVTDVGQKGS